MDFSTIAIDDLWWWRWATELVIPAVGAVGSIAVAIAAIVLANRSSKSELARQQRAVRVQFAAMVREWFGHQVMMKSVGGWNEMTLIEHGGSDIPRNAEESDALNADKLWTFAFSEISRMPENRREADEEFLTLETNRMSEIIDQWVEDPKTKLPAPRAVHAEAWIRPSRLGASSTSTDAAP